MADPSPTPEAPDYWFTGGRFFDDFEAISLVQAVRYLRDRLEPDVSHREVAAILKREGFSRQGYAGAGVDRTPRFARLRATRQQLDAAHPDRHLPKAAKHG